MQAMEMRTVARRIVRFSRDHKIGRGGRLPGPLRRRWTVRDDGLSVRSGTGGCCAPSNHGRKII